MSMLLTCNSPVPLFSSMRGGVIAVLYNGVLGASLGDSSQLLDSAGDGMVNRLCFYRQIWG